MAQDTIELPGEELNRRLEDLSMRIERVSMLLEDTMIDPNDMIGLDSISYNNLMICLARYEEFLNHLHETTLDATEDIRELVGIPECRYCEADEEDEADFIGEEEKKIE